ncbi:MAG: transglutaminase family protein [Acetobacteraceae bacterium]|nr:transglutaminase family protein [Acetobacteraceae bacterium]
MILGIRHLTRYDYSRHVDLGAHTAHLRPRSLPWQRVLSSGLSVTPEPGRVVERLDHFGNCVAWLFLDMPHPVFEVLAESRVDVRFPDPPRAADTPPWEEVAAMALAGAPDHAWQAGEFTFESPMIPASPEAGAYVASSFPPGRPVLEGLLELIGRIRTEFAFRAGATTLHTPISTVLARREGVCQDFTHLMIAGLRALGIPARYVSGYVRTYPPPGGTRRLGADQSHAWVGAWLGPVHGWIDLDPTNNLIVRDEHVVLAWGRDYSDISPLSGIILGGGRHGLSVSVDIEAEE